MARLVRCPKCQKLLVEYPNVSVYQCGGCGIALRTKDHIASREGKSIAESHSDGGFSDSESISGPLTCNLENKAEQEEDKQDKQDKEQRVVDFLEVVGGCRVEDEPVENMEERLQDEGIRDVLKSPAAATGRSLAYYDGSISSSDEVRSVRTPERKFGKSRRTVKAASSSPATTRFNAARDRAPSSSSKDSSLDSFSGELNDKVTILRKIDEVRERLVKICVPSEGRRLQRKQMHHCRPVSGAAPFVICGRCTKLLQLPADFLAPRRRSYKLKCAGCDAVLDLPFPAKHESFSEIDPDDDESDLRAVSGGGRNAGRGNLTTPPLHRLLGYDSASDLLRGDDEKNDRGYAKMESTGRRGRSSSFRPAIPRPPVIYDEQV